MTRHPMVRIRTILSEVEARVKIHSPRWVPASTYCGKCRSNEKLSKHLELHQEISKNRKDLEKKREKQLKTLGKKNLQRPKLSINKSPAQSPPNYFHALEVFY